MGSSIKISTLLAKFHMLINVTNLVSVDC